MERRSLLKQLVLAGGSLSVGGIAGFPALVTGLSPVIGARPRDVWRPVGPLEDFSSGQVTEAVVEVSREDWLGSLGEQKVYVWRPDDGDIVVFSRSCTDLSCPVTWDGGSQCYFCPCHGGIFDINGQRLAGPPKRPLYRYANRIQNGVLEIDLTSVPPII